MWHSFLGDRSKHSGTKRPHRTGFGKVSLEADYRVKNIHDMQSCCILFVYVSMISSQEWAPQTMHKNNRKVHHSAEKSPCHTSYSAHVLELLVFKPQIQQDRLQRLLLGTGLHILLRSASEAVEKWWLQVADIHDLMPVGPLHGGHIVFFASAFKSPSSCYLGAFQWTWGFLWFLYKIDNIPRLCTQNHQLRVGLHPCQGAESVSFIS